MPPDLPTAEPFAHLYEAHTLEASALWQLWQNAVQQPNTTPAVLTRLEQRLYAHIAGCMTAPDTSWHICEAAFPLVDAGDLFVAAQLALRSGREEGFAMLLRAAQANPSLYPGLLSSLVFLQPALAHPRLLRLLESTDAFLQRLALEACRERREDPGSRLRVLLERPQTSQDPKLYLAALTCIGTFKKVDLTNFLLQALEQKDPQIEFYALSGLVLCGRRTFNERLESHVFQASPWQAQAVELAFRCWPKISARQAVNRLVNEGQLEPAICATGVLGDVAALPWLIGLMSEIKHARAAFATLSLITGEDMDAHEFHLEATAEADEEDPAATAFANVPMPSVKPLQKLWQAGHWAKLRPGDRYLAGRLIEPPHLQRLLRSGNQQERHAAALEWSLSSASAPCFNTRGFLLPQA